MKLLLVDDDDLLLGRLIDDLTRQNYVVDAATDGPMGWEYARAIAYDLIVLDIDLPGLDGVSLCQRLRQTGYGGPILLLTGRSSSTDKVLGLDAGADDYLVKPYTLTELTARIRALLRRPPEVSRSSLRWGQIQLDPQAGQVTVAERAVVLSPKEYGLLELFLRYPDRIFSNPVLLERLWNADESPGEETIRTHIKRLRRKLKQAGGDDFIENIYGMGYRLRPSPGETGGAAPEGKGGADLPAAAALCPGSERVDLGETARAEAARAAAIASLDRFRPAFEERLGVLQQAAAALTTNHLPEVMQTAARTAAHKLAGSLGMFGFVAGSHLARQLEDWLEQPDRVDAATFCALVEQLGQQLRGESAPEVPDINASRASRASRREAPSAERQDTGGDRMSGPAPAIAQVLAVDDDPAILAQLAGLLPAWGLEVVPLEDPRQVWSHLDASPPDLVLLDLDMPHLSGLDLCHQLRQSDRWQALPIVFLTACREPATIYQIYQAGAADYLPKPILAPELINRLLQRLECSRLRQTLAGTDPLTGLANRQKGTIELGLLLQLAQRYGQSLSLVRVQVTAPRPQANALLVALGQTLSGQLRPGDAIARWGEAEIVVALLDTEWAGAQAQLQPALETGLAVAATSGSPGGDRSRALHLGGATFPTDGGRLADLYQRAGQRFYSLGSAVGNKPPQGCP
ncbi:response regulator [Leptolyngbya sp. KIOST-1]|uniref:response regulator n=1 Tax=Leptolyngbya sp. KIOST-1 TaxID=1229172 RepID=UPI000907B4E5|nr:response regulator [Leptolyngbya sp. KIOST-1]